MGNWEARGARVCVPAVRSGGNVSSGAYASSSTSAPPPEGFQLQPGGPASQALVALPAPAVPPPRHAHSSFGSSALS